MPDEKMHTKLIDKGNRWECPQCRGHWLKDCRPQHAIGCLFHPENMRQMIGEDIGAFGPDLPMGQPGKVVPIYGWVCSRCNRVYAPGVSECPHCQPPWGCGSSR